MIPAESADLGEDGASGIGVPLALEEVLAKGQELVGVTDGVGAEHPRLVMSSAPLRPFEPDSAILALSGWCQGVELLLKVETHL
jgi:hypothetical protein